MTPTVGLVTVSEAVEDPDQAASVSAAFFLRRALSGSFRLVPTVVAPDQSSLERTLVELCDQRRCCLILTIGGLEGSAGDVAARATRAASEKELADLAAQMRRVLARECPTLTPTTQTLGVRGSAIIANLPETGARDIEVCLSAIIGSLPRQIRLVGGPKLSLSGDVPERC